PYGPVEFEPLLTREFDEPAVTTVDAAFRAYGGAALHVEFFVGHHPHRAAIVIAASGSRSGYHAVGCERDVLGCPEQALAIGAHLHRIGAYRPRLIDESRVDADAPTVGHDLP